MRWMFILALCFLAQACVADGARKAAVNPPSKSSVFGVVSPERAAALGKRANSAEAKAVIKSAEEASARHPRPVRNLRTGGLLPGQGAHDQSVLAAKDFPAAMNLALAWRLTGDTIFFEGAKRYLSAWLETFRPQFQALDETGLDLMLIAFDLLRGELPEVLHRDVAAFTRRLAEGFLNAPSGNTDDTLGSTWRNHRVKLAVLAAFATGDAIQIERARNAFAGQIAASLRPDGSTIDFEERDSLRSVVQGLEPLVLAALAAREHGQDWYAVKSPQGATLAKSLAWLREYAEGRKTHREYDRSKIAFDFALRDAGEPGFSGQWDPREARRLYQMAARLDKSFAHTALLLGRAKSWLALCFPETG